MSAEAESSAVQSLLGMAPGDGGGDDDDDDIPDGAEAALVSMASGDSSGAAMPKQKTCRYDSSLGLLTKKFVALIQGAPEGVLDLNAAATMLGVQKRRIYDITNVLEGIGLIEKRSKNNIQWKGMGAGSSADIQAELERLKESVTSSSEHERWLDAAITQMQTSLRDLADDRTNAEYAYVTHDDVRGIPSFASDTVIAIKAPSGTTLEVPDPDEGLEYPQRRYQIYLKSHTGPVEVFLVSQADADEAEAEGGVAGEGAAEGAGAEGGAADGSPGRRKRGRDGAGGVPPGSSPARRAAAGGGELLKLSPPHGGEQDYWASAPASDALGVNDLYFAEGASGGPPAGEVQVEG